MLAGIHRTFKVGWLAAYEGSAPLLFVVHAGIEDTGRYLQVCDPSVPVWQWSPSREAMPALPPRQHQPT
jgi:hypothetical protein